MVSTVGLALGCSILVIVLLVLWLVFYAVLLYFSFSSLDFRLMIGID